MKISKVQKVTSQDISFHDNPGFSNDLKVWFHTTNKLTLYHHTASRMHFAYENTHGDPVVFIGKYTTELMHFAWENIHGDSRNPGHQPTGKATF